MNRQLLKTAVIMFSWGFLAFMMSLLYYWLKERGLIWDEPNWVLSPRGDWERVEASWNSRKVIIGLLSLGSFVIMILSIINVWTTPPKTKN